MASVVVHVWPKREWYSHPSYDRYDQGCHGRELDGNISLVHAQYICSTGGVANEMVGSFYRLVVLAYCFDRKSKERRFIHLLSVLKKLFGYNLVISQSVTALFVLNIN